MKSIPKATDDRFNEELARRLSQIAEELFDGNKSAFGRAIDMTPQNLNGYLTRARRPGSIVLKRISDLGVSIDWLLTGQGEMKREEAGKGNNIPFPLKLKEPIQKLIGIRNKAENPDPALVLILECIEDLNQLLESNLSSLSEASRINTQHLLVVISLLSDLPGDYKQIIIKNVLEAHEAIKIILEEIENGILIKNEKLRSK